MKAAMLKKKTLRREVSEELVRRGFRRVDRMHLLHVIGEWHFWVDTGPVGPRPGISPWVGVRCDSLESSISELLSLPSDDSVGSLGANIGYILTGKYRDWDAGASLTEILDAIDAAFAKLCPLMDLERMAEGWKIDAARDPIWRYREITLLLLRRDSAQIRAKLLEARSHFCRHQDSMANQFQEFEQRVVARLEIT